VKKLVIKLVTLGVGLVLFLSLVPSSFAYRVEPIRIYLTVARGKTETAVLFLTGNVSNEKVLLYRTNIISDRRGIYSFEKLEEWKYSALKWLKLYKVRKVEKTSEGKGEIGIASSPYKEKETIFLKKDKPTSVGIVVKVPHNIKPGEYYACIMVEPAELSLIKGERGKIKTSIHYGFRIAVPVIVTVPGAVPKMNGRIVESNVDVREKEIKILATFENTGNVLEYVKGKAEIINKTDRRIYDIVTMKALNPQFEDGAGEIFPETLRDFEGVVKRPLPKGEYEVKLSFNYGLRLRKARARTEFSVTQEIAISQKELLTLAAQPELLEFKLKPGEMVMEGLEVINFDFQPLKVAISTIPEKMSWLQIAQTELNLVANRSRKIRFRIRIPRSEKVERSAKIILTPERGKQIVVDVIVKPEESEDKK